MLYFKVVSLRSQFFPKNSIKINTHPSFPDRQTLFFLSGFFQDACLDLIYLKGGLLKMMLSTHYCALPNDYDFQAVVPSSRLDTCYDFLVSIHAHISALHVDPFLTKSIPNYTSQTTKERLLSLKQIRCTRFSITISNVDLNVVDSSASATACEPLLLLSDKLLAVLLDKTKSDVDIYEQLKCDFLTCKTPPKLLLDQDINAYFEPVTRQFTYVFFKTYCYASIALKKDLISFYKSNKIQLNAKITKELGTTKISNQIKEKLSFLQSQQYDLFFSQLLKNKVPPPVLSEQNKLFIAFMLKIEQFDRLISFLDLPFFYDAVQKNMMISVQSHVQGVNEFHWDLLIGIYKPSENLCHIDKKMIVLNRILGKENSTKEERAYSRLLIILISTSL